MITNEPLEAINLRLADALYSQPYPGRYHYERLYKCRPALYYKEQEGGHSCHDCTVCTLCKREVAIHKREDLLASWERVHTVQSSPVLLGTFTLKDVVTSAIRDTVQTINKGWRSMLQHPALKRFVKGWAKSIEIEAYGQKEHVHMHTTMVMTNAYSGRNHLSMTDWERMFAESVGLSAIDTGRDDFVKVGKRVWEIAANYTVKTDEPTYRAEAEFGINDPVRYLQRAEQMHRLRRYQFGGCLYVPTETIH